MLAVWRPARSLSARSPCVILHPVTVARAAQGPRFPTAAPHLSTAGCGQSVVAGRAMGTWGIPSSRNSGPDGAKPNRAYQWAR